MVRVRSAVGAGDSLVGGFLHGCASGLPLAEAFRLGIACGSASAMTPGTELCHQADVRRLLPRVRVQRVGG
jgi:6-phosphofructokinase 2